MTLNILFYISQKENFTKVQELSKKLQTYNFQIVKFTSTANTSSKPSDFDVCDNLLTIMNQLIQLNFLVFITDCELDININMLLFVQLWLDKDQMYFNGKRYSTNKVLDDFVVDLIKSKSSSPSGIVFNNQQYLFCNENDTSGFTLGQIKPCMHLINNIPNISLQWNFSEPKILHDKWFHLTDKLKFSLNLSECQNHVVVNCTNSSTDPNSTIYFCMEPLGERMYKPYLDAINKAAKGGRILFQGTHDRHLNNAEWHLSPSLNQLKRSVIDKKFDKVLSVVVSAKAFDPGHKYRLDLIKKLDQSDLPFELHIYGRCQSLGFKNYKGELPDQAKDDAIFPYKYHLNVENQYINNYITEKLYDGIVGECLTFYKGAPNWTTFFNKNSLVELSGEIDDDVKLITDTIMTGKWEERIKSIIEDKVKILYQYSFEPRVISIMHVSKSICLTINPLVKQHCIDEGFHVVEQITTLNLAETCMRCISQNVAIVIIMTDNCYPNLYDKFCFAFANEFNGIIPSLKNIDFYSLQEPKDGKLDIIISPCGAEKMLKNLRFGKNIFESLRFVKL